MARNFSVSSDLIALPFAVTDPFAVGSAISISAWFKGSSSQSTVRLQTTDTNYVILTWTGGTVTTPSCIMSNDGGTSGLSWPTSGVGTGLNDGNWHHLGMTWGQSATFAIYHNGSLSNSRAAGGTALSPFGHTYQPVFGNYNGGGGGEELVGSIADVALWQVVLTAGEMSSLASGVRAYNIRPSQLLSFWPLDGIQSPEPDLSGFHNSGTLTGTASAADPPLSMFTQQWPMGSILPAPSAGYVSRMLMVFQ